MTSFPLSAVGRIVTGKTPTTSRQDYFGGDIPFVTPSDMGQGRYLRNTARNLSVAGAEAVKNCMIPPNSIMVSCIGSDMGKTYIASSRCSTNQQINSIIVDTDNFSPLFVYYNLFGRRKELRELAAGAAQPILNKTEFGKVTIDFPPLREQHEIAATLGALDDKIELNRETSTTLEEMARGLYRSWFVDFDPVHASAEGRAPAHMDSTTAALFPDSFGEDGLPVGWSSHLLQKAITFRSGKTWPAPLRSEDGVATAFGANGPIGKSISSLECDRVIFVGKIGSCGALNYFNGSFWATNNTYYITSKDTVSLEYARHVLLDIDWSQFIGGSSNPYMPLKNFDHLTCLQPPKPLLEHFERRAGFIRNIIEFLDASNRTLATLRDTLLPRLMSGELRVGTAREMLEEVA